MLAQQVAAAHWRAMNSQARGRLFTVKNASLQSQLLQHYSILRL
jgi:hypothetical protein